MFLSLKSAQMNALPPAQINVSAILQWQNKTQHFNTGLINAGSLSHCALINLYLRFVNIKLEIHMHILAELFPLGSSSTVGLHLWQPKIKGAFLQESSLEEIWGFIVFHYTTTMCI